MRHLFLLALVFLLPVVDIFASHVQNLSVGGDWYCSSHDIQINVYPSRDGIEVTRGDNQETYYYDRRDDRTYLDRSGSGYYFLSEDRMEFRGKDGRQVLRFNRSRVRDRNEWNDDYFEDRSWREADGIARILEGRWYDYRSGRRMVIDKRGRKIKVYYRGYARTFFASRSGHFTDKFGNRLVLRNATELLYFSRHHRRPLLFERPDYLTRRYRYGCD